MSVDPAAPSRAPARTDLAFLSRRSRAQKPQTPQTPRTSPAVANFFASRGPHPPRHRHPSPAAPLPPPTPDLDLSAPDLDQSTPPRDFGSSSLDLSTPDLDLSTPPRDFGSSSLDLSASPAPSAGAAPAPVRKSAGGPPSTRPVRRARSGERTLLSPREPTVTLNRLQSGIGVLVFEAAISGSAGDLGLGCAYDLTGGHTSTVQRSGGAAAAPRNSRTPVIVGRRDRFERLIIDLRRSRRLERMIVYGFSESGRVLSWGGTLIVTTFGGARVELPLDLPASSGVSVFMSLYNVDGEFVIRAEMETVQGSVRDACKAYGFDRISWLDDRNPVD